MGRSEDRDSRVPAPTLQPWSCPNKAQRLEIIESLGARLEAETPGKSIPGTVGGLLIMYHDTEKSSSRSSVIEKHFVRLSSRTASTIDDTDYLYVELKLHSPGVYLSSAEFSFGHEHSGKLQSPGSTVTGRE